MNAVNAVIRSVRGFGILVVPDIETACKEIAARKNQIIVNLVHLDGTTNVSGMTRVLQTEGTDRRPIVTIAISEHAHPEQALIFTRLGVAECMSRPLDLSRLAYLIDVLTIEARYRLPFAPRIVQPERAEVQSLGGERQFLFLPEGRMGRTIEQIKRIAPLDTTVMIGGETGTGKTHLAGVIHSLSPRSAEPFLTINCGALAANLVESEMFGHTRGAFTGADADRAGKFAAVGRGTLFLDEIDSLAPELQAKLLRVVEERAFEAVGSNKTLRLQARLIVASNRPLDHEVAAGRFRSDLFYRINVVAFDLPPLRERIEIVPALAHAQLADHAARNGRLVEGIAPAAMRDLLGYTWPGNVRELRNVIERAVALGHGPVIEAADLPEHLHPHANRAVIVMPPTPANAAEETPTPPAPDTEVTNLPAPLGLNASAPGMGVGPQASDVRRPAARSALAESKDQTELVLITAALERNSQNRLRAAAELGISRMTLYKKLHKYGLMGIM